MIQGPANNLGNVTGITQSPGQSSSTGATGGSSFADMLKKSVDEVSKLQQDATQAVNDVATGQSENVTGVMNAVEKSDLAFKTLLAIRTKLMDAYEEIKQISL
ncbi:MAG TPA: flagellar hook-basal body complex protein FliE [Tepidisphaeraceae bacterium]|jgi:flagellar hook-basal body complex protein FliE|nr:flagellar hook-basal body complex protein FliE [Tepidisphaeraceae bacterium]